MTTNKHQPIRIFISSTFSDMQNERDVLMREVVPRVISKLHSLNLEIAFIDLRWGITKEQAENGQVLNICLQEVERCVPFFIGIIGERYGWVPEESDPNFARIKDYMHFIEPRMSVTEMEIMAALEYAELSNATYLFFIKALNKDQLSPEMVALRKKLKSDNRCICIEYKNETDFGEISTDYIIEKIEGAIDDSASDSISLSQRYFSTLVNLGTERTDVLPLLLSRYSSIKTPILITAEPGFGKSYLLAQIAHKLANLQEKNFLSSLFNTPKKKNIVFPIVLGIAQNTQAWDLGIKELLSRLCLLINKPFDLNIHRFEIIQALITTIKIASKTHNIIIIFDGLEKLDNYDNAPKLDWLIRLSVSHCKIICSSSSPDQLNIIQQQKWPCYQLPLLNSERVIETTRKNLSFHGKQLTNELKAIIKNSSILQNPICLDVFIHSLRLRSSFESLDADANRMAAYTSISDFISSLAQDYAADFKSQLDFSAGLTLLLISETGLDINELALIITPTKQSLSTLQLHTALHSYELFAQRNGERFTIKLAVKQYLLHPYLDSQGLTIKDTEKRLQQFFIKFTRPSRQFETLNQYYLSKQNWRELLVLVASSDVIALINTEFRDSLMVVYRRLILANEELLIESLKLTIQQYPFSTEENINVLNNLFVVCSSLSFHALCQMLITVFKESKVGIEDQELVLQKNLIANYYLRNNNNVDAFFYIDQAFQIMYQLPDEHVRLKVNVLNNLALTQLNQNNLIDAEKTFNKIESICSKFDLYYEKGLTLGNKVELLISQDNLKQGLVVVKEHYFFAESLGDFSAMQVALSNKAILLKRLGKAKQALITQVEEREFCEKLNDTNKLGHCLMNTALTHKDLGNFDSSLDLLKQARVLLNDSDDIRGLVICELNEAGLYLDLGLKTAAIASLNKAIDYQYDDEKLILAMQSMSKRVS